MRMDNKRMFDERLNEALDVSGVRREELARHLDVAAPVVNRWLNGITAPDVYQFQAIARFFGKPYGWFLDGGDRFPGTEELAARLGLNEATVKALLFMADSDDAAVMEAVNDAIWAVFSVVVTMYENLYRRIGAVLGRAKEDEN